MFYDVRVICKPEGKSIVTVCKVFPKKRKHCKNSEKRNYVIKEKKYIITNKITFHIPTKGKFNALFTTTGGCVTFELLKNDILCINAQGDWFITNPKRHWSL